MGNLLSFVEAANPLPDYIVVTAIAAPARCQWLGVVALVPAAYRIGNNLALAEYAYAIHITGSL
jgi:hypothetical protein